MKKLAFLIGLLVVAITAGAQVKDPASWSFSAKKTAENEYELTMKATLPTGWTIYSMYTPDGGPYQTSLDLENAGKDFTLLGKAKENKPTVKFDEVFGVDVWYFAKEYIITQKIKLNKQVETMKGTLEYQVCQEGQCILFEKDFSVRLEKK